METILINTDNINEARKTVDKNKDSKKIICVVAKDDDFNRKILENKKVNLLIFNDFEKLGKNKRLKQRDSGLNHVLCNLAKQNNIAIGLDIEALAKNKYSKDYFSRIFQNLELCKKYKTKIIAINIKNFNKTDLFFLLISFSMNTQMAKYAIDNSINLE